MRVLGDLTQQRALSDSSDAGDVHDANRVTGKQIIEARQLAPTPDEALTIAPLNPFPERRHGVGS